MFCAVSAVSKVILNWNALALNVPLAKSLKAVYVGELLGLSVVVRTAIFAFASLATVPSKSVQVSIKSVLLSNWSPV